MTGHRRRAQHPSDDLTARCSAPSRRRALTRRGEDLTSRYSWQATDDDTSDRERGPACSSIPAGSRRSNVTPALIQSMVEEPFATTRRFSSSCPRRRDIELAGRDHSARRGRRAARRFGQRDERTFPHADRCEVTAIRGSIAFGHGIHICLGSACAPGGTCGLRGKLLPRIRNPIRTTEDLNWTNVLPCAPTALRSGFERRRNVPRPFPSDGILRQRTWYGASSNRVD